MDETPTANVETAAVTVAPVDATATNAPDTQRVITAGGTDLRRLGKTIEIVKGDPEGQKILASELGFITKADVDKQRLLDAKDLAIEAFAIPADKAKFVVGDTPAEIRASAKELAALLNPAATTATTAAQSTAETTATRVELPDRTAETVTAPKNIDEAADAYKAMMEKLDRE